MGKDCWGPDPREDAWIRSVMELERQKKLEPSRFCVKDGCVAKHWTAVDLCERHWWADRNERLRRTCDAMGFEMTLLYRLTHPCPTCHGWLCPVWLAGTERID